VHVTVLRTCGRMLALKLIWRHWSGSGFSRTQVRSRASLAAGRHECRPYSLRPDLRNILTPTRQGDQKEKVTARAATL
jgi:hypothetical protein